MARHTSIDCHEKRGRRGYLFVIGDEAPYRMVKRHEVRNIIGDKLQANIPVEKLIAEVQRTYDTYYVLPKMTAHWDNPTVHRRWVQLLGQNVLRLEEPAAICELIASTIGIAEQKVDLDHVADDLQEAGSPVGVVRAVKNTLAELGGWFF
jgi:hypothetical protein